MTRRNPRASRQGRTIKVRGQSPGEPDEVYTRWSKREYELRRETFDDPSGTIPEHLNN